jgi:hypothetical protein
MRIDPQIDVWKTFLVRHQQGGGDHRHELAARCLARGERFDQAPGERQVGVGFEDADHGGGNIRRAHDVGDGNTVFAVRLAGLLLHHLCAGEGGGAAGGVDDRKLAPIGVRRDGENGVQRMVRVVPSRQQIECQRAKSRIGPMLRQARAGPGARV